MCHAVFTRPGFRFQTLALVSFALFQSACQTSRPPLTAVEMAYALPSDERALASIESGNIAPQRSFLKLRADGDWKKSGYFSAEESDRTELLLFRFHTAHHHLNNIVERYEKLPADEAKVKQAEALRARGGL